MIQTSDSSTYPIVVTVTVNSHGVATCTSDPPTASLPSDPNITIQFSLVAPAGWQFRSAQPAIIVTNPADQFPQPSSTDPTGQTATLFDLNTDSNPYPYTVYVVKTTGEQLAHDPVIKNGGTSVCAGC